MALSDAEKAALEPLFVKIDADAEKIGGEAMESLFQHHPDTKSHFTHMDVTPGSQDLKTHGGKIIHAINDALNHYGSLQENLATLREMHTNKLKLSVDTIKLLCGCLLEVIVKHFPDVDKSACDKFLNEVAVALISS
ncbi:hemoglobin heart muscle subunit alpha-type-like [Bufo bufo]|uniref:hemoglobin heart muscle subunit alpha-type-like n=1 Tax=Bufo bufo TaxID=8384 RepID=UPI001ABDE86B|nr:hemoglobin heart muscle subunit alpha-type-like [Bufo bufo]XP_040283593.1 hemoglobin heart muscle subunit alpha-type-like [Bufo bufo]